MLLVKFLGDADLASFMHNLGQRCKHQEHLAELDPVLRAKELERLQYEPPLIGEGAGHPDWGYPTGQVSNPRLARRSDRRDSVHTIN